MNRARDIRAVAVDETEFFNAEFLEKHKIEKILATYIADFSSHTHCCELTPSVYLMGVQYSIHHELDVSDEVREEADCELTDVGGPEDTYMWASRAEKLPFVRFSNDDPEDTDDEALEHAREYFQGNWPF